MNDYQKLSEMVDNQGRNILDYNLDREKARAKNFVDLDTVGERTNRNIGIGESAFGAAILGAGATAASMAPNLIDVAAEVQRLPFGVGVAGAIIGAGIVANGAKNIIKAHNEIREARMAKEREVFERTIEEHGSEFLSKKQKARYAKLNYIYYRKIKPKADAKKREEALRAAVETGEF